MPAETNKSGTHAERNDSLNDFPAVRLPPLNFSWLMRMGTASAFGFLAIVWTVFTFDFTKAVMPLFLILIVYTPCSLALIFILIAATWGSLRISPIYSVTKRGNQIYALNMNLSAYRALTTSNNPGLMVKHMANKAITWLAEQESVAVIETVTWFVKPEDIGKHFNLPPTEWNEITIPRPILARLVAQAAKLVFSAARKRARTAHDSYGPRRRKSRRRARWNWKRIRAHWPLFAKWYRYRWVLKR